MVDNQYPLVTIGVVTYNSGEYVIETLDSIKAQTYKNIELIVSDDCSNDDTIEKCQKWFSNNASRFVRAEIIISSINTGVSGNSNRAYHKATGMWYKLMDGDDMLMPNAITDYVNYVQSHPEARLVFAPSIHFVEHFNKDNLGEPDVVSKYLYQDSMTAEKQAKVIAKRFMGSGPTCFVLKEAIDEIGGFDERFPLLEDYPLLINLVCNGNKLYLMDKPTVYKRIRRTSIQYEKESGSIFSNSIVRCTKEYKFLYKREHLNLIWRNFLSLSIWLMTNVIDSGNSFKNWKSKMWYLLYKAVDPFKWYSRITDRKSRAYLKKNL